MLTKIAAAENMFLLSLKKWCFESVVFFIIFHAVPPSFDGDGMAVPFVSGLWRGRAATFSVCRQEKDGEISLKSEC